jgi:lipoate-protein ligase A
MYCIVSPSNDPVFNLAAEEYLFKQFGEDLLFMYSNEASVVIGKHQNAMAEINPIVVDKTGIKVIRRMSGGGAVYHDKGNLNFSFHKTVDDTSKVRYSEFSVPVVEVLNSLGIPAEINTRNDIVVGGFKVSGHAQHVFRNRVLSHGTLLINADLQQLSLALKKSEGSYESKAIKSVRSPVANVSDFSTTPITVVKVTQLLLEHLQKTNPAVSIVELLAPDIDVIHELVESKYATWDWNFGYSPIYCFQHEIELSPGEVAGCRLWVEKGIIVDAEITGTIFPYPENKVWASRLIGLRHSVEVVRKLQVSADTPMISTPQLIQLLF